jgi:O-antigen/teichoic acid export membrane protein
VKKLSKFKAGAIVSYAAIAINMLAALFYTPWMVNVIGKSNYGLYTLALSLINMFLLDFGMSDAVTRFVSEFRAKHDETGISEFMGIVYRIYFIIDAVILVVLAVLYFFLPGIYKGLTPAELSDFRVVYLIVAVYSVASFPFITLNGILIAYEQFVWYKGCDILYRLLVIFCTFFALKSGQGLFALVLITTIFGLVIIGLKVYLIRRKLGLKVRFGYHSSAMLKKIFSFSVWTSIYGLAQRMIFNIMPSILGIFSNSLAITKFGFADTLEGYVYVFGNAINGMFMPKVAELTAAETDTRRITDLMIKIGRIQMVVMSLIIGGFLLLGKEFFILWMGEDFVISYYCAALMILPAILSSTESIADSAMIMMNKVDLRAYSAIAMAVVNVAIACVLTKPYGALGGAIAIFCAYTVQNIILNIMYAKNMHLEMKRFYAQCYARMVVPAVIFGVLGWLVIPLIPVGGWLGFLLKAAVLVAIYVPLVWNLYMNDSEKTMVRQMLPHKRQEA